MPRIRPTPLITFSEPPQGPTQVFTPTLDQDKPTRHWYYNVPLYGVILLLLAPHPSILIVLINYYLVALKDYYAFTGHLLIIYSLTFMMFTSLIILVVRDPGPVPFDEPRSDLQADNDEQVGLMEALNSPDDFLSPGRWCRICWAPKPDRTHHCSFCGRCVLKMDHHCAFLGNRCIGYRTYPAFLHFLTCVTLLAIYLAVLCARALYYAFHNPYTIDEFTPVHEILLTFSGITVILVIGSFQSYHVYLVSTNQTTLENINPFLLLRHLPALDLQEVNSTARNRLSDPPLEHELSYRQRRLVKDAHAHLRLYDLGFRENWSQVFGWKRPSELISRILCGGSSMGDGKFFPRGPKTVELLARLARELVVEDKDS